MTHGRRIQAGATALVLASTLFVDTRAANETSIDVAAFSQQLADMNVALAKSGRNFQIDSAEISVNVGGVAKATTVVANNRTHTFGSQFVPRDPRRGGHADLSYLVDQSDGAALAFANPTGNQAVVLPNAVTEPILDRVMMRWQNAPHCPGPAVTKVADNGSDPDLVDGILFGDESLIGEPFADITHAGWLPPAFFDPLTPDGKGSHVILGVTFSLVFVDDNGDPTDIDGDGNQDTAFREIYYNLAFGWTENPDTRPRGIDIDSVAFHEAGHAFGLGHFGKVFIDNNGTIKFAPRAVMNAVYVSPFTQLTGTDNASYCQIWASSN